jgi:hypothetical protein
MDKCTSPLIRSPKEFWELVKGQRKYEQEIPHFQPVAQMKPWEGFIEHRICIS